MSKYPNCPCGIKKFDYHRKLYKNGTLHLFRKCPVCQKVSQNAMPQREYDQLWIEDLPIFGTGDTAIRQEETQPISRVHQKLTDHIQSRNRERGV